MFLGAIPARGRRTVTSWIRATGLSGEYRPCHTAVSAAGTRGGRIAARLAHAVVKPLVAAADRLSVPPSHLRPLDDPPAEPVVVRGGCSTPA